MCLRGTRKTLIQDVRRQEMNTKESVLCVGLGFILAALILAVIFGLREQANQCGVLSSITAPTKGMLDDIRRDVADGRTNVASRKLVALSESWDEFMQGGNTPEQFYGRIVGMEQAETSNQALDTYAE